MNTPPRHVTVVGAGLGGLRTVEALRKADYPGHITLVGAETHLPYDRPPLSKQFLAGTWDIERIRLADETALADLELELRLGVRAVDMAPGRLTLSDGSTVTTDATVVATGVTARRLPGQPDRVRSLRTLDDAFALRADLGRSSSLVVVGAGFIGAEVAGTAAAQGIAVTVLEAQDAPFAAVLGAEAGHLCTRLLRENGVDLRPGVSVDGFVEVGSGIGVRLTDGTQIVADTALVGIGGVPEIGWLTGATPGPTGGLHCDTEGRVEDLENVWALGDVAAWPTGPDGTRHRHEHWNSAVDQAAVVAQSILGAPQPATTPVTYFWSDQFGLKIQVIGSPERADSVVTLHGDGTDGGAIKGTVLGYFEADRLVAVTGFGAPRHVARYRLPLTEKATSDEVHAFASSV